MRRLFVGLVLATGVVFTPLALRAVPMRAPGDCPRDAKLIGQVSVFGDENEVSWWSLIFHGMEDYGLLTDDAKRDYLSFVFGRTFGTLAEAKEFNLLSVSNGFDKNGNGFVCAFDLRGTRAYNNDPLFDFTWFGVSDDKIRKD